MCKKLHQQNIKLGETDNEGSDHDGHSIRKEREHWFMLGFLWKQRLPKEEKSGTVSLNMSICSLPVTLLETKTNQGINTTNK